MSESRTWTACSRCYGERECRVDLRTGQYLVSLPSRCLDKANCGTQALRPYTEAQGLDAERGTGAPGVIGRSTP